MLVAAPALAAPAADMKAELSDFTADGDGMLFTLSVAMGAPSEPYASLDFNLVCSDNEMLAIVDNSEQGDRSNLDISFPPAHGSAYHKGRIDELTGAISYLIGIFSPVGGNAITDETEVCTVKLRYTGDEPQTLSLAGLKLVYKDAEGNITSVNGFDDIEFVIDESLFAAMGDKPASGIWAGLPLGAAQAPGGTNAWLIVGIALAVAAAAVVAFLVIRKRKGGAEKESTAPAQE